MGQDKKDHLRRSTWLVLRRCLTILHRLMHGQASRQELLQIIYDDSIATDEDITHREAKRRFEQDRERLRNEFGVELEYSRQSDEYLLLHIGSPLIDLPDDAINALAFLQQNFSHDNAPMQEEIHALLDIIIMILPVSRRRQLEKQRGLLEIELHVKDEDDIFEDVWQAIKSSISERRQLEFDYLSSNNTDGQLRRHLVEPIRYFFDITRKHYYLEVFWIESRSHIAIKDQGYKVFRFRIGRMQNPTVLPKHFAPNRRAPTKELIYDLTADVARSGVTRHFSEMNVVEHPDGSARVHVLSKNLFFDLRQLLHYGDNCKVIGGDEALEQMQELVKSLYKQYYLMDKLSND